MSVRAENPVSGPGLEFLKRCCRFVSIDWQHADKDLSPDRGFERLFRGDCVRRLPGWTISQPREMHLGGEFDTGSGILHEIDLVAAHADLIAVAELKNTGSLPPGKNDVIVFFAKLLDYLVRNPSLLHRDVVPVFVSCFALDLHGMAACMGLGIHPVTPGLRPYPILVDTVRRMEVEVGRGLPISQEVRERYEDLCARINAMGVALADGWTSSRLGYFADDRIIVRARPSYDAVALGERLRQLSAECSEVLSEIASVKASVST